MSIPIAPSALDRPGARPVCGGAVIAVPLVIGGSLLGLFHGTSPPQWLQPTPDLLALTATCRTLPGRAERLGYTGAAVAAYRTSRPRTAERLADAHAEEYP